MLLLVEEQGPTTRLSHIMAYRNPTGSLPVAIAGTTCIGTGASLCVTGYADEEACGGEGKRMTSVQLQGPLLNEEIRGEEGCWHDGSGWQRSNVITAYVLFAIVLWFVNGAGCWTYANLAGVSVTQRCATSPPNPGWGNILP